MNMRSLIKLGLLAVVLWIQASTAFATCAYVPGHTGSVYTSAPLQVSSLAVGSNVPVGTVIYRQRYTASAGVQVKCTSWANYRAVKSLWQAGGTTDLISWNTGPYANRVYGTDVAGIGQSFDIPQFNLFSYTNSTWNRTIYPCANQSQCTIDFSDMAYVDLVLIKIGNVSPGTLDGYNLSTMGTNVNIYDTANPSVFYNSAPIFTGKINIVAQTCQTPNVSVPLGSHKLSEFNGVGSGTAWQNFNIALNNCPAARSYATNGPILTETGAAPVITATPGVVDSNLSITFTPTGVTIDAAKGIFGLDAPATSAKGIGMQLADSNNSPVALNALIKTGLNTQAAMGSYNIPMSARYTQVSTPLVPGPANASVTFTLTYQ
ncbi:fimbrial protein [Pseudomonas sp. LB3P14]